MQQVIKISTVLAAIGFESVTGGDSEETGVCLANAAPWNYEGKEDDGEMDGGTRGTREEADAVQWTTFFFEQWRGVSVPK